MRIGAYDQVSQLYGNQSIKKNCNSGVAVAASTTDQVSFSSVGKDMQIAKNALSAVSDVREDRIKALKESIANGTYQVSAESFADKVMAAYYDKSI